MDIIFSWKVLGVLALILLVIYFKYPRKNAVWGGLIIGVIIGVLMSVFQGVFKEGFYWSLVWKGAIIGTLIGFGAELLGRIADLHKK